MTNYVKSTNFASKDSLAVGNPLKIVKGTEIDTEFNNIAVAVATKLNSTDSISSNNVNYVPADSITTTVQTRLRGLDKITNYAKRKYVIGITGQSNAAGSNTGGPNPASSKVKTWNGATSSWGGSDYLAAPWSLSTPNGNGGNNNMALALAHRIADDTNAEVFIIYDAVGGQSIDQWVGTGTSSTRYAAFKAKVTAALATTELSGITELDFLIYAQGEEDATTMNYSTYLTKFTTLNTQFRAETWIDDNTPIFVTGMSGLHTRYQVWQAQADYCENVNKNTIYVNSMGLKTEFDVAGTGDYTHFLGDSLWEMGYDRIWNASKEVGYTHRSFPSAFSARGAGPWRGEADAIANFKSIVSLESVTDSFPLNSSAATGSITWGYQCSADGNYTLAGGYQTTTDNLSNYSLIWGRECSTTATGEYSGVFGYQNIAGATYTFATGRGNTTSSSGETIVGLFSKYKTAQADPVMFQVGIGSSDTARKNAITSRSSGATEINVDHTATPTNSKEITFSFVSNTQLKVSMRGTDGVVRSNTLTLA